MPAFISFSLFYSELKVRNLKQSILQNDKLTVRKIGTVQSKQ